jgi:peptidoglycan hydrolase-like protein with peptidoglycan-binding domain
MEILAYIQEEFIQSDSQITEGLKVSINKNPELSLKTWLKQLANRSVKLSFNVILAGTTLFISLGSAIAFAEATTPSDVRYVQSLLARGGFDPGTIDGVAGASTKNAILRAQQSLGLTTDGIAGSQTIAALEDITAKTKANPELDLPSSQVSASVMNLQKLLADRGFYDGSVDGIMGAQTRNAILAAQKAYGLTTDGIAGSRTISALESDSGKAIAAPSRSDNVEALQRLLNRRGFYSGAFDGILGPQTRMAIVAAQKNYGLATDGIAGAQTLAALESGSSSKITTTSRNRVNAEETTTTGSNQKNVQKVEQDVIALQRLLSERGFYNGALDGIKGAQTTASITAAQRSYGLTADGIAGAQTLAALQREARPIRPTISAVPAAPTRSTVTVTGVPTIATGDRNIANLQNLLRDRGFYNGALTGVLGSRTTEAIVAAQKAYGLTADGIAGTRTIAALESGSPAKIQPVIPSPIPISPTIRVETKPQVSTPATPSVRPTTAAAIAQPAPLVTPVQPIVTVAPQPAPTAPSSASNPQILELQNLLTERGFYNGKADGVLSGETRNAIVRAQSFYTISPADGSPSSRLIESLRKDNFISEGN